MLAVLILWNRSGTSSGSSNSHSGITHLLSATPHVSVKRPSSSAISPTHFLMDCTCLFQELWVFYNSVARWTGLQVDRSILQPNLLDM